MEDMSDLIKPGLPGLLVIIRSAILPQLSSKEDL
tara:strand:- start:113 stop:214 length:102 start_codon:yes stop_codon:yes gene_type:complete